MHGMALYRSLTMLFYLVEAYLLYGSSALTDDGNPR